jgi:hypothetical protein
LFTVKVAEFVVSFVEQRFDGISLKGESADNGDLKVFPVHRAHCDWAQADFSPIQEQNQVQLLKRSVTW